MPLASSASAGGGRVAHERGVDLLPFIITSPHTSFSQGRIPMCHAPLPYLCMRPQVVDVSLMSATPCIKVLPAVLALTISPSLVPMVY